MTNKSICYKASLVKDTSLFDIEAACHSDAVFAEVNSRERLNYDKVKDKLTSRAK